MFSKARVEDFRRLDISSMHKYGVLRAGQYGEWVWKNAETLEETGRIGYHCTGNKLRLKYKTCHGGGDWKHIDETILLSKTYPNFGGERLWFICPSCHTRRGVLYGRKYFRCRDCRGACYQTQLEDAKNRALTKVYRRRSKLDGFGGMGEPFPPKPKWMRWATYSQLWEADKRGCEEVLKQQNAWLSVLRKRLH